MLDQRGLSISIRQKLAPTPDATVGPFFPGDFVAQFSSDLTHVAPLVEHRPIGEPISLQMRFLDAAGKPVPSVIVEVWQANARGRYRHPQDQSEAALDPQFDGFARLRTDDDGDCTLTTIKPGPHQVGTFTRAPHLRLTIFASGIDRLTTQVFFEGESLNSSDPVLTAIADVRVRDRLVARCCASAGAYELTIVLRGEGETPFFGDQEGSDA
jgi:protocatechuate 3,4-dioxygenase beta subunit